jgi:putative Holliday junction resolvase
MRFLALDVGDERVGVAISDEAGFLARPLETLRRAPGPAGFHRLAEIIAAQGVGAVIVGLPLLPDGAEGRQVESARAYARGLKAHVAVPIIYWDERYSTQRAASALLEAGSGRLRRRRRIDAAAAAVILQDYLDERSGG